MPRRDFSAFIIIGVPAHPEVAGLGEGIQEGFYQATLEFTWLRLLLTENNDKQ